MLHKLACAMTLVFASAVAVSAQTVDDVIARNIEAKGGLDRLRAVETLRMTGTMTVGPGMEAPFVMEFKRPSMLRMDVTYHGTTVVQAFDGKMGWTQNPIAGDAAPTPVPPEVLRVMEEQADFDGPLVEYKAKGHKIDLEGKEGGAYKLRITFKNGQVRYYFLDATTFLETRVEGKTNVLGRETETVGTIGDYRDVNGIKLPHAMESAPKGSPQKQKMIVQKVEVNPPIDDSRFRMPSR
ncbi:MAG: outer membrane lipoprotein carrier protein LolA [Vicinamibacterales bacterium]